MSQDIVQGRPWVCEPKLSLNVIISPDQDADHHQRLILERVSRLANLKDLTLHHVPRVGEIAQLSLQLGKGLEQLSTLKSLSTLRLILNVYNVSTAEVQVTMMFSFYLCPSISEQFILETTNRVCCSLWPYSVDDRQLEVPEGGWNHRRGN